MNMILYIERTFNEFLKCTVLVGCFVIVCVEKNSIGTNFALELSGKVIALLQRFIVSLDSSLHLPSPEP